MISVQTPISEQTIDSLKVGDPIFINGYIYTGRDAALPKVVKLIEDDKIEQSDIHLRGSAIFHTAISAAGIGPTSSNKYDIESNIPILSEHGVKIHLGKGELSKETVEALKKNNSVYAVVAPVTALLQSTVIEKELVAFPEDGIEAFHRIKVKNFPAIVSIAHGRTIHDEE